LEDRAKTEFFDGLGKRLSKNGFATERDIAIGEKYKVDVIGRKTSFVLMAGFFLVANNLTRYVLVTAMNSVDIPTAKDYSEVSLSYALENRPIALPRPLGGGFLVVPVIVSDDFSDEMKTWVQEESQITQFAAIGYPILLSVARHEAYSPKTPALVGRAFFGEAKKIRDICKNF
jgi:hypothetical protein